MARLHAGGFPRDDREAKKEMRAYRLTSGIYAPPLGTRPGFGVSLAIKDAEHALSLAKGVNARLPGVEIAHGNMQSARDYAGECLDSSSMYGILRMEAGMSFWNDASRQG